MIQREDASPHEEHNWLQNETHRTHSERVVVVAARATAAAAAVVVVVVERHDVLWEN